MFNQLNQDNVTNPMNVTLSQYLTLKSQMNQEILKAISEITSKYKVKLGMTPYWIDIETQGITQIGDSRKQYLISNVDCHFRIE